VEERFSAPVQTGPGAHRASYTSGTGSFPGVKSGRGMTLTPYFLLVPWSRKSKAIPLLPLWDVRPVRSLSACTRVHFTFTFIHEFNITERTCEKCLVRFEFLAALSLKVYVLCSVAPRPLKQTFRRIAMPTFTEPHGLTSHCTWIRISQSAFVTKISHRTHNVLNISRILLTL